MNQAASKDDPMEGQPWYRFGMVWMVIALPLTVVIASLITVSIAIDNAPVIIEKSTPVTNESDSQPAPR